MNGSLVEALIERQIKSRLTPSILQMLNALFILIFQVYFIACRLIGYLELLSKLRSFTFNCVQNYKNGIGAYFKMC